MNGILMLILYITGGKYCAGLITVYEEFREEGWQPSRQPNCASFGFVLVLLKSKEGSAALYKPGRCDSNCVFPCLSKGVVRGMRIQVQQWQATRDIWQGHPNALWTFIT
jgi:hypothetical protein